MPRGTELYGARGTYVIDTVLGRGGFGITYRASASGYGLPRYVAIKEFFPKDLCSRLISEESYDMIIDEPENFENITKLRDRFVKESRNIEECNSSGIVKVLDTIESYGTAYMVMELIEGQTLKQLMDSYSRTGGLPLGKAENIIRQLARSLMYLHSQHITHLDVKPDNLMVNDADGRVVLIDFGLSRRFNADGSSDSQVLTAISKGYAPPEQYIGINTFSPESDIYSMGATFYKLLTGKTPPEPHVLEEDPGNLRFDSAIPNNYRLAILAAMEYDRRDRIKRAEDFLDVLDDGSLALRRIHNREQENRRRGEYGGISAPVAPPVRDVYFDDDSEYEEDYVPRRKKHRGAKWFFNFVLTFILLVCVLVFKDYYEYTGEMDSRFFPMSRIDFMYFIGLDGFLAALGIVIRPLAGKILLTLINAATLVFLILNNLQILY